MSSFRRRLMMAQGGGGGSSIPGVKESEAGDICVYDVNKGSLAIIKSAEWSASKYPIATYVPVGIVAVPASHNHYADGKCAIVSLNYMNCDTPQQGGYEESMCYGEEKDIATLHDYYLTCYVGESYIIGDSVIGISYQNIHLPSDKTDFDDFKNPYDEKTNYKNGSFYLAPSPYNNDGTYNTEYSRITSPSSINNCLADFNGYGNTKKILDVRGAKDYQSWKPTYDSPSDYPAASCCDMYFTQGTKQGDWYLPAAGELGYVCVRQKVINDTIVKLRNKGVEAFDIYYDTHSSSQANDLSSVSIDLDNGIINNYVKTNNMFVRGFCII